MRTGEAGIKLVAVIGADDRPLRCLIATIALGRASVRDDVTQVVIDELRAAQFIVERSVTVNREKEFIRQLVSSVVDSNEADAIVLIGGAGVGPRDFTCEAVDDLADRRLEGFGEAYRRLLFEAGESYPKVVTARATACVYNGKRHPSSAGRCTSWWSRRCRRLCGSPLANALRSPTIDRRRPPFMAR
jgi:molybdenum cofactor biosynthesis protein B